MEFRDVTFYPSSFFLGGKPFTPPPLSGLSTKKKISFPQTIVIFRSAIGLQNMSFRSSFWSTRYLQGDQLYMAGCFCYLVKSDLSSVRMYSSVHFLQGARNTKPCYVNNYLFLARPRARYRSCKVVYDAVVHYTIF